MPDARPNQREEPDAQPAFAYDVFISYSKADAPWVHGTLVLRLEVAGVRVCLDTRDFRLGCRASLSKNGRS